MHAFVNGPEGRRPLSQLTFPQTKQAAAIVDCIGRLIPQEGVDYDIEVTFKGDYDPSVSMGIVPLTDKGEWWRRYVAEMIVKYPPSVENPDMSIPEEQEPEPSVDKKEEVVDAEIVS